MMNYSDFYDIAEYGNENWKGGFSPKEIAENAYEYFEEFRESVGNRVTQTIQDLLELLDEDGNDEATYYANMIRYELNLLTTTEK